MQNMRCFSIYKSMAVSRQQEEKFMSLTPVEREQIQDSKLKLQSAANSLSNVDPEKIEDFESIQDCLEGACKSLEAALKKPH